MFPILTLCSKKAHAMEKAVSMHSLDMDRQDEQRAARQQMSGSTAFLIDDNAPPAANNTVVENSYVKTL